MSNEGHRLYEFGPFCLDASERVLLRDGTIIPLSPKLFEILHVLVRNGGRIVGKEQFLAEVWPDSFVEEGNINVRMVALRRLLGEAADGQDYIQTIPRRGYRFVAPVAKVETSEVLTPGRSQATATDVSSQAVVQAAPKSEFTAVPPVISSPWDSQSPAISGGKGGEIVAVPEPVSPKRFSLSLRNALAITCLLIVSGAGTYWFIRGPGTAFPSTRVMLGVLPFANLSGDPAQDYFSDGLTDELITQISRLNPKGLGLIARTSVAKYRQGNADVRQIGEELHVSYVLEGSVRRAGKRARITAQLIRVSDQTHVWAESYDTDVGDVLDVESEVSRAIAGQIEILIDPAQQRILESRRSVNPEAHDDYLKGLYFWNRRSNQDVENAVDYFQKAIRMDPQYAEAYAGLANTYVLLGLPQVSLARGAAERALTLAPNMAEPHAALAMLNFIHWDVRNAENEINFSLKLNPGYPTAHHWHGYILVVAGKQHQAVEELKQALELDPLSLPVNRDLGLMYYWARDYQNAEAQFKKTLEMDPNFHHTHCYLGRVYEQEGRLDLALEEFQKADDSPYSISDKNAALGRIYAKMGRREEALKMVKWLDGIAQDRHSLPYNRASIYATLGENDKAFALLIGDFQKRLGYTLYLPVDPEFDRLRSDPRFAELSAQLTALR